MKPSRPLELAVLIGASIGVARWVFECAFVVPLVPDPQSPIWIMISTITSIAIAATTAILAWVALQGQESKHPLLKCASFLPLLLLIGWYSVGFISLAQMRSALVDSANPNTKPDRLRELADYKNGPGYEIDNRVARHPHTPPDVLRSLHGRPDQVGTEMCLAQNPNTPEDVLLDISRRNDDWSQYLQKALKQNPRYGKVFGPDAASPNEMAEPDDAAKPSDEPKSK